MELRCHGGGNPARAQHLPQSDRPTWLGRDPRERSLQSAETYIAGGLCSEGPMAISQHCLGCTILPVNPLLMMRSLLTSLLNPSGRTHICWLFQKRHQFHRWRKACHILHTDMKYFKRAEKRWWSEGNKAGSVNLPTWSNHLEQPRSELLSSTRSVTPQGGNCRPLRAWAQASPSLPPHELCWYCHIMVPAMGVQGGRTGKPLGSGEAVGRSLSHPLLRPEQDCGAETIS